MLVNTSRITIISLVIGIITTLFTSFVYSMITGTMLENALWGMGVLVAIFVVSSVIAFIVGEKMAQKQLVKLIDEYNKKCDPYAMVKRGSRIADSLKFPCTEEEAWFLGYYAQATLDVGDKEGAEQIEQGLKLTLKAAKHPLQKAKILVNLVQLSEKLRTPEESMKLIAEGLDAIKDETTAAANQRRNFLTSQKQIIEAQSQADATELIQINDTVRTDSKYPMRVRVEYAWSEALACEQAGNSVMERTNLEFIVKNGNKLSVVPMAKEKLAALEESE